MKIITFLFMLGFILMADSCKKTDAPSPTSNGLESINGIWQNSTWGRGRDVIKISINSVNANGTITFLSSPNSNFSVGDVIFTKIAAASDNSFTTIGQYRYGTNNQTVGNTNATMRLQSNGSVLYVHYAFDPISGITPPDYFYQKQ